MSVSVEEKKGPAPGDLTTGRYRGIETTVAPAPVLEGADEHRGKQILPRRAAGRLDRGPVDRRGHRHAEGDDAAEEMARVGGRDFARIHPGDAGPGECGQIAGAIHSADAMQIRIERCVMEHPFGADEQQCSTQ